PIPPLLSLPEIALHLQKAGRMSERHFTHDGFRARPKATAIIRGVSALAFSARTALRSRWGALQARPNQTQLQPAPNRHRALRLSPPIGRSWFPPGVTTP